MAKILETTTVPIDQLKEHPRNPRRADPERIAESIRAHDQYRALVVQAGTGYVLAGNHTLQALRLSGKEEVLVHYVAVDDEEAVRLMLIDNKLTDLSAGQYDDPTLTSLLKELDDLSGTGYADADLDALLAKLETAVELPSQEGAWDFAAANRGPSDDPRAYTPAAAVREVLMAFPLDQFERFKSAVERIRKAGEYPNLSAVVLAAVESYEPAVYATA